MEKEMMEIGDDWFQQGSCGFALHIVGKWVYIREPELGILRG